MTYFLFRDNWPILRTGELRLQVQVNGVSLRCNNKWTKWAFVDVAAVDKDLLQAIRETISERLHPYGWGELPAEESYDPHCTVRVFKDSN